MRKNEPYQSWLDTEPISPVWTRALARIVFPLIEKAHGRASVSRLHALEHSQWWPRPKLDLYRLQKLQAMLGEAAAHAPYYRGLFRDAGFDPAAMKGLADLERIPFLTKPLLAAHDMRSEKAGRLIRCGLPGPEGGNLGFHLGIDRMSHDMAARARATRSWRLDFGDREIAIRPPMQAGVRRAPGPMLGTLVRKKTFSDSAVAEKPAAHAEEIRAYRPRMVSGTPIALERIADHALAKGPGLDDVGIRAVFTAAGQLEEGVREKISRAFGCAVAESYAGPQMGFVAHECNYGGMHVCGEDILVEIVGGDGRLLPPGGRGEIVVTNMASGDAPCIRYRTGDQGALDDEECECGRGLPMLKDMQRHSADEAFLEW